MQTVDKAALLAFFDAAADTMAAKKEYLIELDAAVGDGDLGLTMSAGFAKIKEALHESADDDLGKLLMLAGMSIAKAVPSTMGTLVGSGFMKAAKALRGKTEFTLGDIATLLEEFTTGLMERGKAQPGDRTIIDAMFPAAQALRAAQGGSFESALEAAAAAAAQGVEQTKTMTGKFGRSVFYGDQVLGKPDQGAIVGQYIVEALRTGLCG